MFTASQHQFRRVGLLFGPPIRLSLIIGGIVLSLGLVYPAWAGPSYVTDLSLYQGFDIDEAMFDRDPRILLLAFGASGEIQRMLEPKDFTPEFQPEIDVFFSFSPADDQLILHLPDETTPIAALGDTPFDAVDSGWLDRIEPVSGQTEWPLDSGDTLVMLTDENVWVKMGQVLFDSTTLSIDFQYEKLAAVPEPTSLTLLGLGLCLVVLSTAKTQKRMF